MATTIGTISIGHRFDANAADRRQIDVVSRFYAIRDALKMKVYVIVYRSVQDNIRIYYPGIGYRVQGIGLKTVYGTRFRKR